MRIYYCPVHGRVDEVSFRVRELEDCEHCRTWFFGLTKKKAKRPGES